MKRALLLLSLCGASGQALACADLSPEVQRSVQRAAQRFGLDQGLLKALLWTESHFCAGAVSPAGALGLGQLMPKTAAALGVNPHDPHQNVYGAAKYLRQMWDQFGDWSHALAAYNAGPGAVQRYGGVPPYTETQRYVRKVLGAYPHFSVNATGAARAPLQAAGRISTPSGGAVSPAVQASPTPGRPAEAARRPAQVAGQLAQAAVQQTAAQQRGAAAGGGGASSLILYSATDQPAPQPSAGSNTSGMVVFDVSTAAPGR